MVLYCFINYANSRTNNVATSYKQMNIRMKEISSLVMLLNAEGKLNNTVSDSKWLVRPK